MNRANDAGRNRQQGQSLAEYGLILAFVAVVSIGALNLLGQSMNTQLSSLAQTLSGINTGNGTIAVANPPGSPAPAATTQQPANSTPANTSSQTPAGSGQNTQTGTPSNTQQSNPAASTPAVGSQPTNTQPASTPATQPPPATSVPVTSTPASSDDCGNLQCNPNNPWGW